MALRLCRGRTAAREAGRTFERVLQPCDTLGVFLGPLTPISKDIQESLCPTNFINSLPGCQDLLLHSHVYVCKPLLFTRLFLQVVLHQTCWVPNLRWGTRLNRVNTER